MFNKKFALLLTKIHAWMVVVSAVISVIYAVWSANGYLDFFEGIGFFIGVLLVAFIYLSIWYLAIYLMRQAIDKK